MVQEFRLLDTFVRLPLPQNGDMKHQNTLRNSPPRLNLPPGLAGKSAVDAPWGLTAAAKVYP